MKRKLYLSILWIITTLVIASCIVVRFVSNTTGSKETVKYEDQFSEVKLDVDVANIAILYADTYSFEYVGGGKCDYSCTDGKLYFKEEKRSSFNVFFNDDAKLTITVPYDTTLTTFECKLDVSNIKIKDVKIDKLKFDCDVSNVTLDKVDFKDLEMKCDVGNIEINLFDDFKSYNYDIETDVARLKINGKSYVSGSDYIEDNKADKSINIKTDVCNVEIK